MGNLRAIDDVVREIIETDSHVVLSALGGDAAAGGVPFALAADHVVAREDVVLNPYYQHMGGLYGSEYWTYLLPRRVGAELTARLTGPPFTSLGTRQAVEIGLLDAAFGETLDGFRSQVRAWPSGWRATPTSIVGSRASGAGAPATRRSSRSTPTAGKSWPGRTGASSARTAATTRRATASSTSSAHRARSHGQRSHRRMRCCIQPGGWHSVAGASDIDGVGPRGRRSVDVWRGADGGRGVRRRRTAGRQGGDVRLAAGGTGCDAGLNPRPRSVQMSTPQAVRAAIAALLSALLALLLAAGTASAATDHVVITGGAVVPAGQTAGDVVVLDGTVTDRRTRHGRCRLGQRAGPRHRSC